MIKPLQHKFAGVKHNNGNKDMHQWKNRKRWPLIQMARGYKLSSRLYRLSITLPVWKSFGLFYGHICNGLQIWFFLLNEMRKIFPIYAMYKQGNSLYILTWKPVMIKQNCLLLGIYYVWNLQNYAGYVSLVCQSIWNFNQKVPFQKFWFSVWEPYTRQM